MFQIGNENCLYKKDCAQRSNIDFSKINSKAFNEQSHEKCIHRVVKTKQNTELKV